MKDLKVFYTTGSIDEQIIIDFAESLRVTFPKSYIKLLSIFNCISFKKGYFYVKCPMTSSNPIFCFGFDYYVDDKTVFFSDIGYQDLEYSKYGKLTVMIGDTAEGHHICFDYSKNPTTDNPPVVMLYHDEYETDAETGEDFMVQVEIAPTFDEFIDILYEDLDDEFAIEFSRNIPKDLGITWTSGSIDEYVINDFAKSLNVTFPKSYVKLLSIYNDFDFEKAYFDVDYSDELSKKSFCFRFHEYADGQKILTSPIQNQELIQSQYGKNIVMIGNTSEGNYICFDYSKNLTIDNPPVVMVCNDIEQGHFSQIEIAPTFDDFINMLYAN